MSKTTRTLHSQPTFENMPVSKLIIEKYYQRKLSVGRVKKIVREFNPHLLKPIRVSVRDGKYYVFDGQHRVSALKILKKTHIMCEVHHGLTFEHEAWLFAHQNDNEIDVSPVWKFHALVQSGDTEATMIQGILNKHGLKVASGGGKNEIRAVKGLFEVYSEYGAETLEKVFHILKKSWGGNNVSIQKGFINGLALFLKNNPDIDIEWLIKNLNKKTAESFKANAEMHKATFKDVVKSYEHEFKSNYEFRRRKDNLSHPQFKANHS